MSNSKKTHHERKAKFRRGSTTKPGCDNKTKYRKDTAEVVAARVSQETNALMNHYHCRVCDAWHIGHIPYYQRQKQNSIHSRVDQEIDRYKRILERDEHSTKKKLSQQS